MRTGLSSSASLAVLAKLWLVACGQPATAAVEPAPRAATWQFKGCPDGRHWTRMPVATQSVLSHVWMAADGALRLQDRAGANFAFDGAQWSPADPPSDANVARSGTKDRPVIPAGAPPGARASVQLEANAAVVVGDDGLIAVGTADRWDRMDSGSQADLNAVWATANGDMVAVGEAGVALHYVCGKPPVRDELAAVPGCATRYGVAVAQRELYGAWGRSRHDFYVAGAGGVWHVVGGKAKSVFQRGRSSFEGIWGEGSRVIAVGTDRETRRMLALHCDADECDLQLIPTEGVLRSVSKGANGLLAVGNDFAKQSRGVVMRYSRGRWLPYSQPNVAMLSDIVRDSAGTSWIAGTDWTREPEGTLFALRGPRLESQSRVSGAPLADVSIGVGGNVFAVGGREDGVHARGGVYLQSVADGWAVKRGPNKIVSTVAAAASGDRIVAAVVWESRPGAPPAHLIVTHDADLEETIAVCATGKPLQRMAVLEDGSAVVVGDDGIAFVIEQEMIAQPQHASSGLHVP